MLINRKKQLYPLFFFVKMCFSGRKLKALTDLYRCFAEKPCLKKEYKKHIWYYPITPTQISILGLDTSKEKTKYIRIQYFYFLTFFQCRRDCYAEELFISLIVVSSISFKVVIDCNWLTVQCINQKLIFLQILRMRYSLDMF